MPVRVKKSMADFLGSRAETFNVMRMLSRALLVWSTDPMVAVRGLGRTMITRATISYLFRRAGNYASTVYAVMLMAVLVIMVNMRVICGLMGVGAKAGVPRVNRSPEISMAYRLLVVFMMVMTVVALRLSLMIDGGRVIVKVAMTGITSIVSRSLWWVRVVVIFTIRLRKTVFMSGHGRASAFIFTSRL